MTTKYSALSRHLSIDHLTAATSISQQWAFAIYGRYSSRSKSAVHSHRSPARQSQSISAFGCVKCKPPLMYRHSYTRSIYGIVRILINLRICYSNLYFRTVALLEHGIHVMFVADGKPPQLKAETIRRRLHGPMLVERNGRKPVNRSRFAVCMREVFVLAYL